MNMESIKNDLLASVIVFLVAIPLCLGIALASNAPLMGGLLAGIIGGIVVGIISGSALSVSGPAAGMIAVVLASITQLGSYEAFLMALTLAGAIQIISGLLRAGFIANFVPTTVIQGLLAAIGILIVIKQIPLAFGYYAEPGTLKASLKIAQETLSLSPVLTVFEHIHAGAAIITIASLFILVLWDKKLPGLARKLPSAVVVVLFAITLNEVFKHVNPLLELGAAYLVDVPTSGSVSQFVAQLQHPDFSSLTNTKVYLYAFMLAIVASLESLLNLEAVEKLDSKYRYTSRNRELIAQGVGNTLSGLVGGLPITSVIVRSSVNINAGANSKVSTISHGVLLLFSITIITEWLNYIPLASLAAILMYTGYKLARPSLFQEVYREGVRYFIPFLVTVVAIVVSNLLLGIVIGLITSILYILHNNSKNGFMTVNESHPSGNVLRLILPQQATFLNKAAIVEELNNLPQEAKVIIDAKSTDHIDNDILGVIKAFKEIQAAEKNILLNLIGFQQDYRIKNETKFINVTTYDVQVALTPEVVLTMLIEGNKRFIKNTPIHKDYKQQIIATSAAQHPIAAVLGCIDSRVPVELIFDVTFGDVFVARIAGNIANTDILGSLEFACQVAGAKLIVVLGHKECGAIKAACDNFQLGHITHLIDKIKPAIELEKTTKEDRTSNNTQFVENVIRHNVDLTKKFLYDESDILRALIDEGKVAIVGAVYNVHNGKVEFEAIE